MEDLGLLSKAESVQQLFESDERLSPDHTSFPKIASSRNAQSTNESPDRTPIKQKSPYLTATKTSPRNSGIIESVTQS